MVRASAPMPQEVRQPRWRRWLRAFAAEVVGVLLCSVGAKLLVAVGGVTIELPA